MGVGAAGSLPQTNIHPSEECIGGPGQQIDFMVMASLMMFVMLSTL